MYLISAVALSLSVSSLSQAHSSQAQSFLSLTHPLIHYLFRLPHSSRLLDYQRPDYPPIVIISTSLKTGRQLPTTMAPQTPVISDAVNELFVVADQYQIVINPDSANGVVGEQLNARMRAGIGQVEMQIQSLTKQLKAKDEIITTMRAEKERVAHKRKFNAVFGDDDDEDENYWADKERAARKWKLGESDDDDGHDEDEEDEERELGGGDENLIAIYEATKALMREFPRCMLPFPWSFSPEVSRTKS